MAKLTDLSVSFLSLVKTPATGKGLTLKAADGQRPAAFELVVKNDDMMRAYGVVYAPNQEDAHGDTADADTIRKAQAEFMREGRLKNIDTEHSFTSEMAYVAESWLVRKGDPLFPDEPSGAWAVGIQIGDPDLWKQLKSGALTGISLAGIARTDPAPRDPATPQYTEKDAEPGWVSRLIKALTGAPNQETVEETDMTDDEVKALVVQTLKSVLPDALKEAIPSAGDPPAHKEPTEVEKVVAAALKAHGIAPQAPAAEDDDEVDMQAAVEKALTKALGSKVEDAITKALAKGATETDPMAGFAQESFA